MPSGNLGSASLLAATDTLLYTVPADTISTVNIRICNTNASIVSVRVAIGTGSSPTNTDYIDYDIIIPAHGILEDTAIVCSASEKIWVRASLSGVSVRVHGFEENV